LNNSPLSEKSTLEDLFKTVTPEEGVQTMPVSMNNTPTGKAQLMILIAGEPNTANVIMANLMTVIQDMHETAEQQDALIEDTEGNKLHDDDKPSILVP